MTNHKELINTAIHNYYHDNTELEMELKDYLEDLELYAQSAHEYIPFLLEIQKLNHMSRDYDIQVAKVIRDFEDKLVERMFGK